MFYLSTEYFLKSVFFWKKFSSILYLHAISARHSRCRDVDLRWQHRPWRSWMWICLDLDLRNKRAERIRFDIHYHQSDFIFCLWFKSVEDENWWRNIQIIREKRETPNIGTMTHSNPVGRSGGLLRINSEWNLFTDTKYLGCSNCK